MTQNDVSVKVLQSIVLEKGEVVKGCWRGNADFSKSGLPEANISSAEPLRTFGKGFLVLTTERLIWVQERGLINKSYAVSFGIPLETVRGITGGGIISKFISVIDDKFEFKFHLSKVMLDDFQKLVNQTAVERKDLIEKEKKSEKISIVLDFGSLQECMKTGGLALETFKCPNCGASVDFPASGDTTVCKYCHSTIKVEDILGKIKSLL